MHVSSMVREYIQVITAIQKRGDADRIARGLVERRLAGSVQVLGPIVSTYWWKGNIETTQEWLLLIKSVKALYREIEAKIKEIHPYEVPEIIAVPIVDASEDYLEWLRSVTLDSM